MYISAAARTSTANPPIAIPIIGPVPSEECEEDEEAGAVLDVVGGAVGVAVAPVAVVVRENGTSAGKYCSGLNSVVAFCV
jgi:hypothetical protein